MPVATQAPSPPHVDVVDRAPASLQRPAQRAHYDATANAFTGHQRFVLEDGTLTVHSDKKGTTCVVPVDELASIKLLCEAPGAYTAHLKTASGERFVVPARHYLRAGSFEDRSAAYGAFMSALHAACIERGTSTRYQAGSTGLYGLGWFMVVVGLGLLAMALVRPWLEGVGRGVGLGLAAVVLMVGGALIRQGSSRPYLPSAPPAHLLPVPTDPPTVN